MTKSLILTALLFLIILISSASISAQDNNDKVQYQLFRGIRPSGMGGAFEAVADDINAFHYNPAGLANNKHHFQLLIIKPQLTEDTFSEVKDLSGWIDDAKPIAQSKDPLRDPSLAEARKSLVNRLEGLLEESLGGVFDLPAISLIVPLSTGKNRIVIGGSAYTQAKTALRIERRGLKWKDPIIDMLDNAIFYETSGSLNFTGAVAAQIPFDIPMILSKISVGAAFRKSLIGKSLDNLEQPLTVADIINRNGADGKAGTDDDFEKRFFDPEDISNSLKSINTFGVDLGAIVTPTEGANIALVLRNAVSSFSKEDEASKSYPSDLILSASIKPFKLIKFETSKLDLLIAASVEDLSGSVSDLREKAENVDKIHLGVEGSLSPFGGLALSGRIGNNQGFPTIGISAKLGVIYVDLSRFGDVDDDWYAASVSFTF